MFLEDEAQVTETTETPVTEETSAPLGEDTEESTETRFVSSAEKVAAALEPEEAADDASEADDETLLAEIDAEIEEAKAELSDEDMRAAEQIADEVDTTETSDSEELTDSETTDVKPTIEKRINKLVAEREQAREGEAAAKEKIASLEERLQKLETKEPSTEKKKEERLSDSELKGVIQTAMEENDPQTILDVINYKTKITKEDAIKELSQRDKEAQKKITEHNAYWQTIVKDFSPTAYKSDMVKGDAEFDISNPKSALYKRSEELYLDPRNFNKYREKGNMRSAVQDAFIELLSAKIEGKSSKKKTIETEGVRNRKAKENRRKSAGGGTSSIEESFSPESISSAEDELASVLNERKTEKARRTGGTGV